jgi:hypothetical protein
VPDLAVTRDTGGLVRETWRVYRAHAGVFLALAAVVVFPVELIFGGIGLGELTSGYPHHVPAGLALLDTLLGIALTTPLITAMHVTAVLDLARGDSPSLRRSTQVALDAFPAVLGAMLIYLAGVALGFVLIVPGVYWAVRWYFVTQAVLVDGRRGSGALVRSAELVDGSWWRVVGIAIAFNLLVLPVGFLAGLGIDATARAADSGAVYLAGTAVAETVTFSFLALATTLVYFDLRFRREGKPPTA